MKTRLLFTIISLMSLISGAWADSKTTMETVTIPTTGDSYIDWNNAAYSNCNVENSGANVGSTRANTVVTFSIQNDAQQDYIFTFATGANGLTAEIDVTLTNSSDVNVLEKVADVENTGSWTPTTQHNYFISQLPVGTYTLRLATKSTTGSYAGNWGKLAFYTISDFGQVPGAITLSKGNYNGPKENNGDVGYVQNNGTASYSFFNTQAGICTVSMDIAKHNNGSVDLVITDEDSGTAEAQTTFDITESASPANITLTGSLTTGIKTLKLTFHNESGYICNYSNMSLSIDASNWKDIAIDLRDGQLGTEANTAYTKYLTIDGENSYSYADAEPESYNAILSCTRFHDNTHGYVDFKAKVPVESGIYKITLGTCAWGSNACVKNSDETSTLNVTDVNGQTVQSVNQNNGACYHNNTTENVVSMWYTASTDETITIVCGQYTPYIKVEKVSSVPELKYSVTYANTTDGVEGTVPSIAYATAGTSVTLPVNRTLYKDGYTLTGWNDGTTTHETGTNYTPTANVTMTAVFTQNTCTFDQTVTDMTVRWDFQRQNGCPRISIDGNNQTAILVQQADVNGNTIDMKLDINTSTNGKFANGSWTDWAQVKENTTLSFPSVEGATVKAYSMDEPKNGSDVKSSVDGNEYSEYASYIATYATTPTSNSSTLTVKGGSYYRYIDVTYPAAAITGITELTVDGVALGSDIIVAINTGDAYTATFSDNTYTSVPEVVATFDTSAQATGVVSGTGTSRTYTITQGDKTYTLIIEGIHVYNTTGDETSIDIKMNEGTVSDNVWTNGIYTMTTSGIGSSGGADFKFDANTDAPYTISVPADVVVKQFIIKNFHANYSGGDGQLKTVTSTGATTYIPTKRNCVYNGETTAPNRTYEGPAYDLVVTVENHVAGTPIVFTMKKSAQPMGWIQLTTLNDNPGTEPAKTGEEVNVVNNHAAVSVTFDREIPNDVTATINGGNVTAEGGATTLVFPVWNLSYSTNYTLTIPANAVEDAYGNKNGTAIEVAVNVPAKAAVEMATYDYVVGNADELLAALDAIQSTNQNDKNAARKTVFLKNGDYNLGSSSETVRWVRSHNLSLIGESRDGVVIHGTSTGISNPVLNLRYWQGFYLQDLTVRNDFDYGTGSFNGVSVAVYGGDKTVMKNVRMQSNQDTQVTGDRAYFEDCKIHGTVDFICGGGDNFYYHTDLILENRGGNVIVAPSTNSSTKWGYVFQECTIKAVDDAAAATNAGSYYLGRPWQNEPRSYFLNTTMTVLPNNDGWAAMGTLPTHFYEYNSMNSNGDALDLSVRKNSPTSTNTYTPVLTDDEAAKYTLENVLGGTDSWLPTEECVVVAAPTISASGATISWDASDDARCYVIFKDGTYLANTTETSYDVTEDGAYTVRPANLNGGLGATSNEVQICTITTNKAGWASFTPAYDCVVEGAQAYIVTAINSTGTTFNSLDATAISVMKAGEGYFIKGAEKAVAQYTVNSTAETPDDVTGTMLVGCLSNVVLPANSGSEPVKYFLGTENDKAGLYYVQSTAVTIPAGKCYLNSTSNIFVQNIKMDFADDPTGVNEVSENAVPVPVNVKVIKNGQLYIGDYNVAGARIK